MILHAFFATPSIPLTGSSFEGYVIPVCSGIAIILVAASFFIKQYKPLRDASIKEAVRRRDKAERDLKAERAAHGGTIDALREELGGKVDALRSELEEQGRKFTEHIQKQERTHREELAQQEDRHREEDRIRDERHAEEVRGLHERLMLLIADKYTLEQFIASKGQRLPNGLMADGSGLPLPHTPTA